MFRTTFTVLTCLITLLPNHAARALDWGVLATADVVIIGEVHDNPHHHIEQAEVVRRLAPAAVVFEMVRQASEAELASVERTKENLEILLNWEKRGWPEFALYWPVFQAAGDVTIFGAEQPRADVRLAYKQGAASAFSDGAGQFGLDLPLPDDERARREAGQLAAHCDALPPEALPGMVEAQRFRDAHIAAAVLRARAATGGQVVLITGNGHARKDQGVPAMLHHAMPGLSVLSVGQFEEEAPDDLPFDDFLISEAVERPDPCEAFLNRKN